MSGQLRVVVVVVAALVLAGGGFAAGMTLGPGLKGEAAAANGNAKASASGQLVRGGAGAAAQVQVSGKIISVNNGSVTIETQRPGDTGTSSTIALVGGDTRVVRIAEQQASLSDLKPGDQVLAIGSPDAATGTITARALLLGQNVLQQLLGGFGGRAGGGGAPHASGSPTAP